VVVEVVGFGGWPASGLVRWELANVSCDSAGIPIRRKAACAAASRGAEGRSPLDEVPTEGWEVNGV
jgi:hypothetical protein